MAQRRVSLVDKLRGTDFPLVFRGYDRVAVDSFLEELSAAIAELEAKQSSEAVIRKALEEVGQETSSILQRAHESAEETASRSRSQAEGRIQRAEGEAAIIVREAERRAEELDADAERIWNERSRLIEDLRRLAEEILTVADDALERFPPAPETAVLEPVPASDPEEAPEGDAAAGSGDGDAGDQEERDQ